MNVLYVLAEEILVEPVQLSSLPENRDLGLLWFKHGFLFNCFVLVLF